MFGEDATDVSSVRTSVPHFKSSEKDTGDCPNRRRPAKATTAETKENVDALIWNEGRIRAIELCIAIGIEKPAVAIIRKSAVMATIRQFSYRRVCARWASKVLSTEHK